jgi:tRNA A-37 threonylcarbamoyl transferase component Bud32
MDLSMEEVCERVAREKESVGAIEIGRGASATIFAFASGCAKLASGERVPLADIVVKLGRWRTQKAFDKEVRLHRVAADAGCAPLVYHATARPVDPSVKTVEGTLAMQRLTHPTFYRWLHWLSLQLRQEKGLNDLTWTIDKAALRTPIFKAWEKEVKRLLAELIKAGVAHGDVHERNMVFDIPEVRGRIAPGHVETLEEHIATKQLIMEAIGEGPAGGRARIVLIDYGGAHGLSGRLDRFLAKTFIDRHIVDPDEEPPSPMSHRRTSAASTTR